MNTWTIAGRLRATLATIIVLLLAALGLAWWLEGRVHEQERKSAARQDQVPLSSARIRYALLQMSEALRDAAGISAAETNAENVVRKKAADLDLGKALDETIALAAQYPELRASLAAVKEYDDRTLNPLEEQIVELVKTDPAAAQNAFTQKYAPALLKFEGLVDEVEQQVKKFLAVEESQGGVIQWILVGVILLVVLVSLFAGQRMTKAIAGPLAQLLAAMEKLRAGDFTGRLALSGGDEFGQLAEGLNNTSDRLAELIGQMQKTGIQVNTSVNEMAATLKEQQATANEVASTTVEVGATAKEISASARELGRAGGEVAGVAENTAQLASSGQAGLSRLEATMRQILEAATTISAKLGILNEKTANINAVVTTINKVADQTNLLSLNAAIEAEKAGEYGQGFAVVATEIRRLADQTAVATYDIEQMVKEMQSAVAAGVMGMDKFNEEVRKGGQEAGQVTAQLGEIIQQVQQLTPRFEAVNEGMQAQATAANQISDALGQLGDTTQQSVQAVRQNAEAIDQLSGASRGLQDAVSRFKVK